MKQITVKETFRWAENGVDIVTYEAGETVEVSDECAKVAIREKWAVAAKDGDK
jgi:hypothetical protein